MNNLIVYLLNFRNSFFDFFAPYLGFIKIFSATISALLFLGIIYCIIKLNFINTKIENYMDVFKTGNLPRRRAARAWLQIKKKLQMGDEENFKLAVTEADKLLDELLKIGGYEGKNIEDRLKKINAAQLSNINDIWSAHKIRQRIEAEPEFHITRQETELIINIYKKSFQEMGLID
jgi:hypothetical protein